jgi:hypothetical protein
VFAPGGSIHRKGCAGNGGVVDISHGATDGSALRLRRIGLLAGRRDRNNTQDKSTQPMADSHGKQDAAAERKGSGPPDFFTEIFYATFSSAI